MRICFVFDASGNKGSKRRESNNCNDNLYIAGFGYIWSKKKILFERWNIFLQENLSSEIFYSNYAHWNEIKNNLGDEALRLFIINFITFLESLRSEGIITSFISSETKDKFKKITKDQD